MTKSEATTVLNTILSDTLIEALRATWPDKLPTTVQSAGDQGIQIGVQQVIKHLANLNHQLNNA